MIEKVKEQKKSLSFDEMTGNERARNILKRSLQRGKVPSSLLFYGPQGVGKIDAALILAKALNCLHKREDACGECSSCKAIKSNVFPDVIKIEAEKDEIKINQIRMIKQAAYLRPMTGKKRVFIIEQAERMNQSASNSLLKVLEEPPLFSHIILTTDNLFSILPTIKSRCQILKFAPISEYDIQKKLMHMGTDEERAKIISLLVQGSMRRALEFDWDEAEEQRKKAFRLFSSLVEGGKPADSFKKYSRMRKENFEQSIKPLLEIISSFCRDIILLKSGSSGSLLINPDYREALQEMGKIMTLKEAIVSLGVMEECTRMMERNINRKNLMNTMTIELMDRKNV
ncbi:MAG: DNA polymerase III subunit delta' [Candidatus Aminicenantes bacterium]|nr:DNA polymerase III subunit delta' [Candidatus Aminicenantes bacterium]